MLEAHDAAASSAAPTTFSSLYVQNVDLTAPGNALESNGRRVAVEAVSKSDDESALEITVDDAPAKHEAAAISPNSHASAGTSLREQLLSGLTPQEQLFRTKYGWAAFNEAQKALRQ